MHRITTPLRLMSVYRVTLAPFALPNGSCSNAGPTWAFGGYASAGDIMASPTVRVSNRAGRARVMAANPPDGWDGWRHAIRPRPPGKATARASDAVTRQNAVYFDRTAPKNPSRVLTGSTGWTG